MSVISIYNTYARKYHDAPMGIEINNFYRVARGDDHLIPIIVCDYFLGAIVSDDHYLYMVETKAVYRVDIRDLSKKELWCQIDIHCLYQNAKYYHPYIYIRCGVMGNRQISIVDTRQPHQIRKITLDEGYDMIRRLCVCNEQLILQVTFQSDEVILRYDLQTDTYIHPPCKVTHRQMMVHDDNLICFHDGHQGHHIHQVILDDNDTIPYSKSNFTTSISSSNDEPRSEGSEPRSEGSAELVMICIQGDRLIYVKNYRRDLYMLNIITGDDVLIAADFYVTSATIIDDTLYAVKKETIYKIRLTPRRVDDYLMSPISSGMRHDPTGVNSSEHDDQLVIHDADDVSHHIPKMWLRDSNWYRALTSGKFQTPTRITIPFDTETVQLWISYCKTGALPLDRGLISEGPKSELRSDDMLNRLRMMGQKLKGLVGGSKKKHGVQKLIDILLLSDYIDQQVMYGVICDSIYLKCVEPKNVIPLLEYKTHKHIMDIILDVMEVHESMHRYADEDMLANIRTSRGSHEAPRYVLQRPGAVCCEFSRVEDKLRLPMLLCM